ncbi:helix-turn-helix domain-containing protein, partial [Burkholderia gladioli]
MDNKTNDAITLREAAHLMNLTSEQAVAYHVTRGHLSPAAGSGKNGARMMVRASDVRAFVEACEAANPSDLMRVEEVARRLGLSQAEVLRQVKAGRLRCEPTARPVLGIRGRLGMRFRQESVARFLETVTSPATTMTAEQVREALNLLGDDQVMHLARSRGWSFIAFENPDGTTRLYVQKSDVTAFASAGKNPLRNRYSLDQAAAVVGYRGSAQIFRMARKGELDAIRDEGRVWIADHAVHALRDRVAARSGKRARGAA